MSRSIVRVMFRPISVLTSVSTFNPQPYHEERGPTWGQIVFKAHPNLALGVRSDREARFAVDVLFGEVDVALRCGVDDVNVDALAGAGSDVGSDDDECVWVGCVPYALFGRDFSWREGELDGGGKGQQEEKEKSGGEHGST